LKNSLNVELQSVSNGGYLEKKLAFQRRKLAEAFLEFKGHADKGSILEVGMMPISPLGGTRELQDELDPPLRAAITRCSIANNGRTPWRCTGAEESRGESADGQRLPYQDGQFDWVVCNGVIEHAGSRENQDRLLRELARVAKKGVFLTTENRRHPIEFHTGLPLLHWLPQGIWRAQLKLLGKGDWASESILNPLGSDTLRTMASQLPNHTSADIGHLRIGGIKAHFFLMIRKQEASS
jgi:hypothetical protein